MPQVSANALILSFMCILSFLCFGSNVTDENAADHGNSFLARYDDAHRGKFSPGIEASHRTAAKGDRIIGRRVQRSVIESLSLKSCHGTSKARREIPTPAKTHPGNPADLRLRCRRGTCHGCFPTWDECGIPAWAGRTLPAIDRDFPGRQLCGDCRCIAAGGLVAQFLLSGSGWQRNSAVEGGVSGRILVMYPGASSG